MSTHHHRARKGGIVASERNRILLLASCYIFLNMEPRVILINLLVKLGVAAALASALVRSVEFKRCCSARSAQSGRRSIWFCGWASRWRSGCGFALVQTAFCAGDLSLETAILLGVVGRTVSGGMLGGALLAFPALLHGEWATLPFIAVRFSRRTTAQHCPGPGRNLVVLAVHRSQYLSLDSAQSAPPRVFDWQIMFFVTIVGLRFLHTEISRFCRDATFSLESPNLWVEVLSTPPP